MSYEKSFVGFIDILGFKEAFRKNKNNDQLVLLELLRSFAEQNGALPHKK